MKNNCKQPKLFGKDALAVGGFYKCEHDDNASVAKEKNIRKVTVWDVSDQRSRVLKTLFFTKILE